MINIIKQEGLYKKKVNSSLVSNCNCKMVYCPFPCSGDKEMFSSTGILQITDVAVTGWVIFLLFLQSFKVVAQLFLFFFFFGGGGGATSEIFRYFVLHYQNNTTSSPRLLGSQSIFLAIVAVLLTLTFPHIANVFQIWTTLAGYLRIVRGIWANKKWKWLLVGLCCREISVNSSMIQN